MMYKWRLGCVLGLIVGISAAARAADDPKGNFGAEYEVPTVGGPKATAADREDLKKYIPKVALQPRVTDDRVARLKRNGEFFFPIGIYGDWAYMPYVPTSHEELKANGMNCLLSNNLCQRIDLSLDPPKDSNGAVVSKEMAKALYDEREMNLKKALEGAERLDFALISNLEGTWGGLYENSNYPSGWNPRNPKMIVQNVKRLKVEPSIWSIYTYDEPEGWTWRRYGLGKEEEAETAGREPHITDWYFAERAKVLYDQLTWYYDLVKKHAPNKPIMQCLTRVVAMGMDGYDIQNTAAYKCTDIHKYPENKMHHVAQFCYESAMACEIYGGGVNSYIFSPGAYDRPSRTNPHLGKGTLEENKYQVFAPVVYGAKGIIYWCAWWSTRELLETRIFPNTRALSRMGPYILAEHKNELVSSNHDVSTWAPLTGGVAGAERGMGLRDPLMAGKLEPLHDVAHCLRKKGDEYLLLAVNNTKFNKDVTFSVRDLPANEVRAVDFFSGKEVIVRSGKINTKMVPYDVQAWVLPAADGVEVTTMPEEYNPRKGLEFAIPEFGNNNEDKRWELVAEETFDGAKMGNLLEIENPRAKILVTMKPDTDSWFSVGRSTWLRLNTDIPGDQRLEYEYTSSAEWSGEQAVGALICSNTGQGADGYYMSIGRRTDPVSVCLRNGIGVSRNPWEKDTLLIKQNKQNHIIYQRAGDRVTCIFNGKRVVDFKDNNPLSGGKIAIRLPWQSEINNVRVYTRE